MDTPLIRNGEGVALALLLGRVPEAPRADGALRPASVRMAGDGQRPLLLGGLLAKKAPIQRRSSALSAGAGLTDAF